MSTQSKVAQDKVKHPERYCSVSRCLWKTSKLNHDTQVHELNRCPCGKHDHVAQSVIVGEEPQRWTPETARQQKGGTFGS
jgi:hypothetical protein